MKIDRVFITQIDVGPRHRAVDPAKVSEIRDSIAKIGLLQPITVWSPNDETLNLVAGRHRLEAARELGWEEIPAIFLIGDETDCEMAEIAENLHRADLTALQRSEQIGRWVLLADKKAVVLSQVATKVGRPASGERQAARKLNLDKDKVNRAVKIASLSDEAKAAAVETGQDDNQTALLEAAKLPISQQATAIRNRTVTPRRRKPSSSDQSQYGALKDAWVDCHAIRAAWDGASLKAQQLFLRWLDGGAHGTEIATDDK